MRYPGKMKFAGLIFALFLAFQLGNSVTYAQISPTETPQPSCVNGQGWIHGTLGVRQGKQLNGLPLPLSRSDTSFAYGPPDSTFYSLGRGGWVSFSFPAEVSNISGDEVMIYEETFGRSTYPMESAKVYVSDDGVTWKIIGKIATSRINALGITSINIGETGLSQIRYIKLQDIISRDNFYPESDGFDVNAIGAKSVVCPEPSPTPTPTLTLTPTLTITPSLTRTPTSTPTRTPTPAGIAVSCVNPTVIPAQVLTPGQPVDYHGATYTSGWSPEVKYKSMFNAQITPAAPMGTCYGIPCQLTPTITPGDTRLFVGVNLKKIISITPYYCDWKGTWVPSAPAGYGTCTNDCEKVIQVQ
jgi:hypothetical protein